eukprot:SAG11_NODE_12142_length_720_cov_0.702093_1_plen_32_part_10
MRTATAANAVCHTPNAASFVLSQEKLGKTQFT